MKILDLTTQGNLTKDNLILFNKVCDENREIFSNFIGEISLNYPNKLDWLISSPASRNTINSNLYYNICSILFIEKLLDRNKSLKLIIVESNAVKKILLNIIERKNLNINVKCSNNYFKFFFLKKIKLVLFFIHTLMKKIYQKLLAIFLIKKNAFSKNSSLILIDTYSFPGFVSKDRYYNGLYETVDPNNKKNLFFFPTIVLTGFFELYSAYNELKNSSRKFIIKENYITFLDILLSVFYCIRVNFIKLNSIKFNNIEISSLIGEELGSFSGYTLAIEGLQNYYFIKRLSQKQIKIKLLIDWWENQSTDKALHFALNKYYPNTKVIGYLGYIPRKMELQLYPTIFEEKLKIILKIISVLGRALVNEIKEFNSNQCVIVAPAFRYQYLWNKKFRKKKSDLFTILVALPIADINSFHIIKLLKKSINYFILKKYRIIIKKHPASKDDVLKNILNFSNVFEIGTERTIDYFKICNLTITGGVSSTSVEGISLGIPSIIVLPSQLQYLPVPDKISKKMWKVCSNNKEMINAIDTFHSSLSNNNEEYERNGIDTKLNYFEKVSEVNINKFIES